MHQNAEHWNHPDKIIEIVKRLVEVPSVSGTLYEAKMADTLADILREMPYFQANPDNIIMCPLPEDPLKRSSVIALYRGKPASSKTVVLLSHFDVVGVRDYGNARDYAFLPDAYTERLRSEWYDTLDDEAKHDLDSHHYLFARGIMDMKAGLAIQLAVLSELAAKNDFTGNIVLVATPDEEVSSLGMFAAIPELNRLQQKLSLAYELYICSEPSFSSYPGDDAKYIYTGSVGKLLPLIVCVGKETHAGEPMTGLNAAWMAAEIVNEMELSHTFVEQYEGEVNPPPTCLKIGDLKTEYNVQTPGMAYVLYNVLTLNHTPLDVLHKVTQAAHHAAATIETKLRKRHELCQENAHAGDYHALKPNVLTYEQLYKQGQAAFGPAFVDRIHTVMNEGERAGLDLQQLSLKVATEMALYFPEMAPFYLLMFAPPYYPHIYLSGQDEREKRIQSVVDQVVKEAKQVYGEEIKVQKFFGGLSDVSYCRIANPDHVVTTLRENMPLFGNVYRIPIYDIISLDLPAVNIGPFGKDAHKRTERLELNFSTKVAPQLLKTAIHHVLS